jgi:hypothetical protein
MSTTHDHDATTPNLPIPAGATADDWVLDYSGAGCRSLEWSRHDTGKVGVAVDGWQTESGEVTRSVSLYDTEAKELTADDARQLAAKLVEAADALERLQ